MVNLLPVWPAEGDMMTIKLVVVKPFLSFKRGDAITDPGEISRLLAAGHAASVVRVLAEV
jgi:hypothetical protein